MLVYRRTTEGLELLIAHPGGPLWAKKDDGAWTIPKGEYDDSEEAFVCARREFEEEIGQPAPSGEAIDLGEITQKSGKVVHCWAVEGEVDVTEVTSNHFEMEWPPKSGRRQSFPEVDRAMWATFEVAQVKLNPAQTPFVDRLVTQLREPPGGFGG